jgi:perosamine synthetase
MKRVSKREKTFVKKVLKSEFRNSKRTSMVRDCEVEFADLIGCNYAIGFVNGTSTLHIALEVLGVGPGDEVIVPPLTMAATTMAVLHTGATPIFADVDQGTFQISALSISKLVSKNTKAIITVALYGGSPDYDAIKQAAPNIPIIEDNAEALGTTYKGENIGNFGVMSSYSFQTSKHLTAGEGGMLCTNNSELADRIRVLQSLGYGSVSATAQKIEKATLQDPNFNRHISLGWNYRMSELTAAVVRGQIQNASKLIKNRIEVGKNIFELASSYDNTKTQGIYPNSTHSFWAAPLLITNPKINWKEFANKFNTEGGKGVYAAWKLTFNESFWLDKKLLGREKTLTCLTTDTNNCPQASIIQPRILAFRTNEWDKKGKNSQIKALEKTLKYFSNKIDYS